MKTLIVATDYSNAAENALNYAAALAQEVDAKLVLLNAFQLPIPASDSPFPVPEIHELIAENKARLEEITRRVEGSFGIEVSYSSVTNSVREELSDGASRFRAELLIVGMKKSSIESSTFVDNIMPFMRKGSCPLLIVPEEAHFKGIAKILLACDNRSLSTPYAQQVLQDLATSLKARVQVLHIDHKPEGTDKEPALEEHTMEKALRGIKHHYRSINQENTIEGIEKGANDFGADLIVMAPSPTNFWDHIFHNSHTRAMAFRTRIPLLSIPTR